MGTTHLEREGERAAAIRHPVHTPTSYVPSSSSYTFLIALSGGGGGGNVVRGMANKRKRGKGAWLLVSGAE